MRGPRAGGGARPQPLGALEPDAEPGAGSDLQGIRTTAIKDGNHLVVNGSKTYITNGQNADVVIVVAKTDPAQGAKGTSLVLVDAGKSGVAMKVFEQLLRLDRDYPQVLDWLTRCHANVNRAEEAVKQVNGDAPLTENGEAQAEAFGKYWAPLLLPKAQQGALHVFNSPMQRNLQTVAPLMRRLHAAGVNLTSEVRPDNCEVPGCVHAADDETYAEVGRLVAEGQNARRR